FINKEGMHGFLRHEAKSWLRRRCIVIQPAAYAETLFPALRNHPASDILSLIWDAGEKCRPYIARAITALRITDYEGQALLMQINTLVMGLFAELIHQVNRMVDAGAKRVDNGADIKAIRQAQNILRENLKEAPTIEALFRQVAMNRKKLQALFQQTTGMTVGNYTRACRMERAMELLGTDMLIRDIAHEVGYASPGRFSKASEAMYHMTPKEYRESLVGGGHPVKIDF
ncbi:MAG: AraC family transcriptional regulator, partial [Clostridiales bacterium]|nr:AraC family transcriptional regulator [Clostridiales bacterium]